MKTLLEIKQKTPVFFEKNKEFKSERMRYNLLTKKGRIQNIYSKESDGFIYGFNVKKDSSNAILIRYGSFTTCDANPPHFYIRAKKLKMIPEKSIVTSSANLQFGGKPTPLFLPFGIFPSSKKRSSGIIIPRWGESETKGISLEGIGLYILLGKHFDISSTIDYYFKSRDLSTRNSLNYKKIYKYSGGVNFTLTNTSTSFEELPDYTKTKSFSFSWNHRQDPKANPFTTLSANVNFNSSTFYQNTYNVSRDNYLRSNFSSSISLSHNFPNKPMNMNIGIRQSGNVQTKQHDLVLPSFSFSVNRLYPLKRKVKKGKEKWYERIALSYSAQARNDIKTTDSLLFKKETYNFARSGMQHRIPISTSFKVFRYFSLSPSFNYTERWYPNTIRRRLNREENKIETDTIKGFASARDYNSSLSLTTKVYGYVGLKKGFLRGIRHVMTPSISFNYNPEFGKEFWGYYKKHLSDTTSEAREVDYSIFQGGIYGSPPKEKSARLSLSLNNNLEIKTLSKNKKSPKDDPFKKTKIIDNLSLSTGYDFAKDSLNWSDMSLSIRTKLLKALNVNYSSSYSFYGADTLNRIQNIYEYEKTGYLLRFLRSNISTGFGYTFSGEKLSKGGNEGTGKGEKTKTHSGFSDRTTPPPSVTNTQHNNFGISEVDFTIPWSLSFNYNLNINFTKRAQELTTNIVQTLSFNGSINISEKWKIGFRSGYNFIENSFTRTDFTLSRDLHCWIMNLNLIPFGPRRSYNFKINVKSGTLKDLKFDRNNFWYDNR